MPTIDVNEVILGGDIAGEPFVVIRRQEIVGDDGFAQQIESRLTGMVGAIAPVGDNSLVRQDAYTSQNETLQVVTTFMLRGATQNGILQSWQPDLVLWQNSYYLVQVVNNYSQYGRGFIHAECMSFNYNGPPPSQRIMPGGQLDFQQPLNSGIIGALSC